MRTAQGGGPTGRCVTVKAAVDRPAWWASRDTRAASRVVGLMTMFGSLYAVGISFWAPASLGDRPGAVVANLVSCTAMFLLAVPAAVVPHRMPRWAPFLLAVLAGLIVTWLDVLTMDTSFGGFVYLAWPAFFGAYYLRRGGAWVVAALAVLSAGTVPLAVDRTATYGSDLPAFVLTVVAITAALTTGRDRAEQLLARLRTEAEEDPLTGLATRRVFDAGLADCLGGGRPCTLVLADIDRFKVVNDRWGHHVGDAVLQAVGAELGAVSRSVDVVARLGGDELAVLLLGPDAGDPVAGRVVAERFRAAVAGLAVPADGTTSLRPTVSVGVATTPGTRAGRPAESARDLVIRADEALYEAKRSGRDRVVVRSGAPPPGGSDPGAPGAGRPTPEHSAQ